MLPLENAVDHLKRSAAAADAMLGREEQRLPPATQARINASSRAASTSCCSIPQGLPGRPWFRNLIYAPGTLTGYGAKTLPGVREAIEQRRWDDARAYVVKHRHGDRGLCRPSRRGRRDGENRVMNFGLSNARLIELVAAVLILGAGIVFLSPPRSGGRQLRQPGRSDPVRGRRDHGHPRLGGLDYHPTKAEADYYNGRNH